MSVTINGQVIVQPTLLTEELLQIQHDQTAIDGSMQRNRLGQKASATLEFDWLTTSGYQQLITLFTTGSGVTYNNTQSNYAGGVLTFTGLPSIKESAYVPGSSLYRKLTATIRQV